MLDWIAAAVALLAAAAALWQAGEARKARRDADKSASDASESWQRIAGVLEAQERRAVEAENRYEDPWEVLRAPMSDVTMWDISLGGSEQLTNLRFELEPKSEFMVWGDEPPSSATPGRVAYLDCARTPATPREFTLTIRYRRPNEEEHRERVVPLFPF